MEILGGILFALSVVSLWLFLRVDWLKYENAKLKASLDMRELRQQGRMTEYD